MILRQGAGHEFEEVCMRRIGNGQEIMHISLDATSERGNTRMAVLTRDKRVQVWTLDGGYHLSIVFSIELLSTVPRASVFHGQEIVVFGMYDGEV